MGSELGYSELSTPTGSESGVYPHPSPQVGIAAEWDPGSDQIWLNTFHNYGFSQAQWAWITAHELGHAIGFGHSGSPDYGRTIMMSGAIVDGPGTGLNARPLEKCAAVQNFPVDIQQ